MSANAHLEPMEFCFSRSPDIIEQTWRWWHETDGDFSRPEELREQLPYLQIAQDMGDGGVPPFLIVGKKSTTAQVFGEEFARTAVGMESVPDKDYDDAIIASYKLVAWDHVPRFEYIAAKAVPDGNTPLHFEYHRLIVPAYLPTKRRIVICAAGFTVEPRVLS